MQKFLSRLRASHPRSWRGLITTIYNLGFYGNLAGVFLVFHFHVRKVGFDASKTVQDVVKWLTFIGLVTTMVYWMQSMVFSVGRWRSPIPRMQALFILSYTNFLSVPALVAAPGEQTIPSKAGRWSLSLQLFASLAVACYLTAMALHCLVEAIFGLLTQPSTCKNDAILLQQRHQPDMTVVVAEPFTNNVEPTGTRVAEPFTDHWDSISSVTQPVQTPALAQAEPPPPPVALVVLVWVLRIPWRLIVGFGGSFFHTCNWIELQVMKRHPQRILMVASGLMDLAIAAIYYMAFFDGEGTHAPGWAEIFG